MNAGYPDSKRPMRGKRQHLRSIVLALPAPSLPSKAELLADSSEFALQRSDYFARLTEISRSLRIPRAGRAGVPFYVTAASTALVAIWLVLFVQRVPFAWRMSLDRTHVYVTQPGGPREITLPDDSKVTLSGATEVTVLFSEHRRYVLLKKGEALFKVKHDPQAPFEVDAGSRRITDLGTAFDVRRYSDEVVVSVTEGSVSVSSLAREVADLASNDTGGQSVTAPQFPWIKINAGEQFTYTTAGEVTLPHPVNLQSVTSWLYGHRVYRGQALSKVIQDVQLYTPQSIELDPAIATVRYSGYLDQRHVEQWVRGLPTIYPVEVDDSDPRSLAVRCRSEGCPELRPEWRPGP